MRRVLLLCASLAILGLAACDSSSATSSTSSANPAELVGIWKDSLSSYGAVAYLQLKSDASGTARIYQIDGKTIDSSENAAGTWSVSGNKLIIKSTFDDEPLTDTATYLIAGDSLKLDVTSNNGLFDLLGTKSFAFKKASAIVPPSL